MTLEEHNRLFSFFNLISDYLYDGHSRNHEPAANVSAFMPPASKPPIPQIYLVDEDEESDDQGEDSRCDENFSDSATDSLEAIVSDICACKACDLSATRTNTVPGEGSTHPLVLVIGEGPGADEDAQGKPFVGRAGKLLDKMLAAIDLSRDENCYIANMVKCRPPGNRDPAHEEISSCFCFLKRQIILLKPKIILCAGRIAAKSLLKTDKGLSALRGEFRDFAIGDTVIPVLCTFHPSALLRDEANKRPAWEDLKLLRQKLNSPGEG